MEQIGSTSALARRRAPENGGFPDPPAGDPVHVVRTTHAGCGSKTRIRLPQRVPASVVRHVVCDSCHSSFACDEVEEIRRLADRSAVARILPVLRPPLWLEQRPGTLWAWVSVPLAASLVVAALTVLQGGSNIPEGIPAPTLTEVTEENKLVERESFALVIPPGWGRSNPPEGATFAAAAATGGADAALFISREPDLPFKKFLKRSLDQVTELTGNASVIERINGPTTAGTSVRIRGEAIDGAVPVTYDVTLRAVGELRFYLATSLVTDAPREARDGIEVLHSSLIPAPEEAAL